MLWCWIVWAGVVGVYDYLHLLRVIDIITLVLLVLDCGLNVCYEFDWFVVIVYLLFS